MNRLALGLLALTLSSSALAVPMNFQHQGRVFDSAGQPIDGVEILVFRLYDTATGGTMVWEEILLDVDIDNGYYAVELGHVTALDSDDFDGNPLYMSIKVGSGAETTQRITLLSVPYAVRAGIAEGLEPGSVVNASEIQIAGTTVIDSAGQLASGSFTDTDTLGGLGCTTDQIAEYDGSSWVCSTHEHDASDIVGGTLIVDRLPIGTSAADVAAGDHGHTAIDVGALPSGTLATDIGGLAATTTAADIGAVAVGDPIVLGDPGDTCTASEVGTVRYLDETFEGCTNFGWVELGRGGTDGSAPTAAGDSCSQIKADHPGSTDGLFWVDLDGSGSMPAVQVECDMTTGGVGWMHVTVGVLETIASRTDTGGTTSLDGTTIRFLPTSRDTESWHDYDLFADFSVVRGSYIQVPYGHPDDSASTACNNDTAYSTLLSCSGCNNSWQRMGVPGLVLKQCGSLGGEYSSNRTVNISQTNVPSGSVLRWSGGDESGDPGNELYGIANVDLWVR